jgi:AcrR family transcriptional regulator
MSRAYTQIRRAEQKAATRRRIVEAAVDLHSTVGPALTTISMIAERAGVQRHTLYAHFPDAQSLFTACSGLTLERDPLPEPEAWRTLKGAERLRTGLAAIYDWYERNAGLLACVLRDAEYHPPTKQISALRFGPAMAAYQEVLGAGLGVKQRAMLRLALSFYTWRTLVREEGLGGGAAVGAMVQAIMSSGER